MSLINCRECKSEISDQAINCPNCGCPSVAHVQKSKKGKRLANRHIFSGMLIALIGFFVMVLVQVYVGGFFAAIGFMEAIYGQLLKK